MKKSAQVVMLPTNEKAEIGFLTQKGKERGHLVHFDRPMPIILDSENQHLYILSDEEIKEGDWFVGFADGSIKPFVKQADESTVEINNWQLNKKGHSSNKKIIATTDRSLGLVVDQNGCPMQAYSEFLPQIPQSFIEHFVSEYNKGNVITDVMVEYESIGAYANPKYDSDYQLKINSDNTITINISMPKDSWSRKEVIELIQKYSKECTGWPWFETDEKWIEENL